jgi:hypothetical protein
VKESILKVEHDSLDEQLYGFAIAAKRYVVFDKSGDCISIRDPKAHGLGFLMAPEQASDKGTAKGAMWVEQGWQWILDSRSGLDSHSPSWFELPAMMKIAITTPQVLRALQASQRHLPYRQRAKPYNFVLSPLLQDAVVP